MTRRTFALMLFLPLLDSVSRIFEELLWGELVCVETGECYEDQTLCRLDCQYEGGLFPGLPS